MASHLTERQRVRLSERRHGFNTAIGAAHWAAQASPARQGLMRSARLPDPTLTGVAEESQAPPQQQLQPIQVQEPPPTPTPTPTPSPMPTPTPMPQPMQAAEEADMDDGATEPYLSDHNDQDFDDHVFNQSEQIIEALHQENATIRAQLHDAKRQINLLRRLHRTQAELDGLSGAYWRGPSPR